MHELSIAREVLHIIDQQQQQHGFTKVITIYIRAGALTGIVPEALEQALAAIAPGTCVQGARLEMEVQPMELTCRDCNTKTPAEHGPKGCRQCGSTNVHLEGTTEFEVVSLEVDQE